MSVFIAKKGVALGEQFEYLNMWPSADGMEALSKGFTPWAYDHFYFRGVTPEGHFRWAPRIGFEMFQGAEWRPDPRYQAQFAHAAGYPN